jgi:flagellar FliL protein
MAKKPKSAADEDAAEGAEAAPAGKLAFLKNKFVLIGLALLLAGGGGGGWWFMKKSKEGKEQATEGKAAPKKAAFLDMKDMVINISSGAQAERQSFIKLRVTLEVADAKTVPEIQPLLPRVEDTFQVYMRELRAADLDGSAGMFRLKEELLRRVNLAVYPAKVDAVLFKELLVQ